MIPPQITGNARRSGCAVRAQELDRDKLRITIARTVPVDLIYGVVTDVYNALVMIEWGIENPGAPQASLWNKGPYGQPSLSIQSFLGPYSQRAFTALHSELKSAFSLFIGRQTLAVKSGTQASFDIPNRILTVTDTTTRLQITGMIVSATRTRTPDELASFIEQRGIAADNCIVTDAQLS